MQKTYNMLLSQSSLSNAWARSYRSDSYFSTQVRTVLGEEGGGDMGSNLTAT